MDSVDYSALQFWLQAGNLLFTIGLAVFVWIDRGRKDNQEAIKTLSERHEALERRMITAEEHLRHAPTHDDIADLREEQAGIKSTVERMAKAVDRIHDYLLNNK